MSLYIGTIVRYQYYSAVVKSKTVSVIFFLQIIGELDVQGSSCPSTSRIGLRYYAFWK